MHRGMDLESMCLYDFIANMYEVHNQSSHAVVQNMEEEPRQGQPCNLCSLYQEAHPFHATCHRINKTEGHSMLVNIIGVWLPRESETGTHNLHYASLLVLWKPWHQQSDLKGEGEGWQEAFQAF